MPKMGGDNISWRWKSSYPQDILGDRTSPLYLIREIRNMVLPPKINSESMQWTIYDEIYNIIEKY
jgi:hypothetical protein